MIRFINIDQKLSHLLSRIHNKWIKHLIRLFALFILMIIQFNCSKTENVNEPTETPLSYLELFPAKIATIEGDFFFLNVIARDLGGSEVSDVKVQYTGYDPEIVQINSDGLITIIGEGVDTIYANAGGQTSQTIIYAGSSEYDFEIQGTPHNILDANYIDLSKIERISRFRSAIGHSFNNGSETCRSMKHYYQPKLSEDWTKVDIFAPAAGTILRLRVDGAYGYQVTLRPFNLPSFDVIIFHVNLDSQIVEGSWVEAGEHIGRHASQNTMSDIAVGYKPREGGKLISFFEVMTDEVFEEYNLRGVNSREAAIISKEERDADPVPCVDEQPFTEHGNTLIGLI